MTLNKTAIEWCDVSWNPVTGCKHGCSYCYAKKIAERFRGTKAWPNGFEPTLRTDRSADPMKEKRPRTIFVCSMADLFGEWVPDRWIDYVMESCDTAPWHTYIFLTKNPKRYLTIPGKYFQKNRWFGATVTNAHDVAQRIHWLQRLPEGNTFISFEPLLEDPSYLDLTGIKQVIIGAQTNPFYPVQVSWIQHIVDAARKAEARIFVKDSLKNWMGDSPLFTRELCWQVHK